MPKAQTVRKTKSTGCMCASNDPTDATKNRKLYITKATEIVQELQRSAETIVRDCKEVLSKCNGTRKDIFWLKHFNPSDENDQCDGPYTIEFERSMKNLEDYVELAERNDRKAGGSTV
jgi:hypothetical protein